MPLFQKNAAKVRLLFYMHNTFCKNVFYIQHIFVKHPFYIDNIPIFCRY